jgi:Peptidase family M28
LNKRHLLLALFALGPLQAGNPVLAQHPPPAEDSRIREIVAQVSADRIRADITMLVGFGTRNTMSDTLSQTRGIGAARRWIKAQFDSISAACGNCLDVRYVAEIFPPGRRLADSTNIVNVVAIQRGRGTDNRLVLMSGDIDSRITRGDNAIDSAPGANDNASGMAGTIEAARVLSHFEFNGTIVYAGLSGEEQGLYGGGTLARFFAEDSTQVIDAVLNNDMIGNIEGVNGVTDNTTARVFSDGTPPTETDDQRRRRRFSGGEVDGISRQVARYVDRIADQYITNLDIMMIYRLDRFGRGGHHTPFANLGYPAVRIMEANENYTRQHQDIRVENGIAYGDVLAGVNFDYARKLTALNAATLASLAASPGRPQAALICGAVRPNASMKWDPPLDTSNLAGYRVYWRLTDSPTWDHSKWIGNVNRFDFEGLIIDNYFFGVAAVSETGSESTVVFPTPGRGC